MTLLPLKLFASISSSGRTSPYFGCHESICEGASHTVLSDTSGGASGVGLHLKNFSTGRWCRLEGTMWCKAPKNHTELNLPKDVSFTGMLTTFAYIQFTDDHRKNAGDGTDFISSKVSRTGK